MKKPVPAAKSVPDIGPGSIVRLRCGGPEMVVGAATEPPPPNPPGVSDMYPQPPFRPGWICYWSIQRAMKTGIFPPETLELVDTKVGDHLSGA